MTEGQELEGLVERLTKAFDEGEEGFNFDASQAFDGDRYDLEDAEVEIPLLWLRQAAHAITSLQGEVEEARKPEV